MSDDIAVRLTGVGKMYRIYSSRLDRFLDAVGLSKCMPWHEIVAQEFWALRGIDLELKRGQRLGVIGRNGAGKSTLLRMLTRTVAPTVGEVHVHGKVHALVDAVGGFHPEFTGRENIRAALTYQGFTSEEILDVEADIADFTELDHFLDQPLKTYSLGMQARLTFAAATAVIPDLLIVDEMLGAGDAYFLSKSKKRMAGLIESGATVIVASHSLEQITLLCERAIWIERGKIAAHGPAMEVVKAYDEFIRELEDRRLTRRNRTAAEEPAGAAAVGYENSLLLALSVSSHSAAHCDLAEVALFKGECVEEKLLVGDAQDSNVLLSSYVLLQASSGFTPPMTGGPMLFRRIGPAPTAEGMPAVGHMQFNLHEFQPEAGYWLELEYRTIGEGSYALDASHNGRPLARFELPSTDGQWQRHKLELTKAVAPAAPEPAVEESVAAEPESEVRQTILRRWPGSRLLTIENVELVNAQGRPQAVYRVGSPMRVNIAIKARDAGTYRLLPTVTLLRLDGVMISNHAGGPYEELELDAGEQFGVSLDFGPLNLGNANYVLSVALFESEVIEQQRYDLIDRTFEFQVTGNNDLCRDAVFQHPHHWELNRRPVAVLRRAV